MIIRASFQGGVKNNLSRFRPLHHPKIEKVESPQNGHSGGGGRRRLLPFTVLGNFIPPFEKKVDLPVRKIVFGTGQEIYIDHHLFVSLSLRECISRQN